MTRLFATLTLVLTLGLPLAARADEAADKLTVAKSLVEKTLIKTLDTGFSGALEKTVSQMPDETPAPSSTRSAGPCWTACRSNMPSASASPS